MTEQAPKHMRRLSTQDGTFLGYTFWCPWLLPTGKCTTCGSTDPKMTLVAKTASGVVIELSGTAFSKMGWECPDEFHAEARKNRLEPLR